MVKIKLAKNKYEMALSQLIKTINDKPTANITLNGKLTAFFLIGINLLRK